MRGSLDPPSNLSQFHLRFGMGCCGLVDQVHFSEGSSGGSTEGFTGP